VQGYDRKQEQELRLQAKWMSMILSSQMTEPVTPWQLLGEEEPAGPSEAEVIREGERKLKQMQKKYPHLF
jgi:hypothetical protein